MLIDRQPVRVRLRADRRAREAAAFGTWLPVRRFLAGSSASLSIMPMPAATATVSVLGTVYVSASTSTPKWFARHGLGISQYATDRSLFALEDEVIAPAGVRLSVGRPVAGSAVAVSASSTRIRHPWSERASIQILHRQTCPPGELASMEKTDYRSDGAKSA